MESHPNILIFNLEMSTSEGIIKAVDVSIKKWKDRWEDTLGYILAERFSGYDVICARINYGFEMDFGLERYIEANFPILENDEFWAAVVCPLFSIYDDWREYKEEGKDHKHLQLMEAMRSEHPRRGECLQKLRDEDSKYLPPPKIDRTPAPRLKKRYEVKPDEEVDADMDNEDWWSFTDKEPGLEESVSVVENPSDSFCTTIYEGEDYNEIENKYQRVNEFIKVSLQSFVETGRAIKQVKDERLYRNHYETFEDWAFCELGYSRIHAYRHIGAYEVCEMLPIGNRPSTESHARELTPLVKQNPDAVGEAWQTVTEKATEEGRKVTAKDVKKEVKKYFGESKPSVSSIDGFNPQYDVTMSDGKKTKKSHQQLIDMGYTEEDLAEYRRNDEHHTG